MYYDDYDYCRKRLEGTILQLFNKKPVYCHRVEVSDERKFYLSVHDLPNNNRYNILLEEVDLTPVKLGYINVRGKTAYFSSRKPMRSDWKQGLSQKSFVCEGLSFTNAISYGLKETILNSYPTLQQAVSNLGKSSFSSLAFHRNYALRADSALLYRDVQVGAVTKQGIPVLHSTKYFLQQELDEVLKNANPTTTILEEDFWRDRF